MVSSSDRSRDVMFEITEHIGVITTYQTGWQKELNIVSWNGGPPKYDIRDWDPEHEHMSKGITLYEKEMRLIMDMIKRKNQNRSHGKDDENNEDIPVSESSDVEN